MIPAQRLRRLAKALDRAIDTYTRGIDGDDPTDPGFTILGNVASCRDRAEEVARTLSPGVMPCER